MMQVIRWIFVIYHRQNFSITSFSDIWNFFRFSLLFDAQVWAYFFIPFHLIEIFFKPFTSNHWVKRFSDYFAGLGVFLVLLINIIDLEFFNIKGKRTGAEIFYLIQDESNPVFSYIINYFHWLLLLMALFFIFYKLILKVKPEKVKFQFSYILIQIIFIGILFLSLRGGLYLRPLRSSDAPKFVKGELSPFVINTGNQIITTITSQKLETSNYFEDEKLKKIINPVQQFTFDKVSEKPNIVLIILESFGRDYCGFLNPTVRYTPFLDSLALKSLVYENVYSAGNTSIESLPAIFCSLPSLFETPFINSLYQGNKLQGIHYHLNKIGYNNSFYYGAANGSMSFDNFLKNSGPIDYFGLNEYPQKQHHDGHWGIWDLEYLDYFCEELKFKKTPFFSTVFTLSSHDPFKVPEKFKNKFKKGELPIHQSIGYTDYALSVFFKKAEKQKWFENTIFIITADHPSHSKNSYFYSPIGKYEIPLLFYSPKFIKPQRDSLKTISQCDILPTILDLTQYSNPFFSIGQSVFRNSDNNSIHYDMGIYSIIQYPYCFRIFPNKKTEFFFHPKNTPNENIRYEMQNQELDIKNHLDTTLKAKLQTYQKHLVENRWFVK